MNLTVEQSVKVKHMTIEDIAHNRLDEWARWNGRGTPVGPADPKCILGKIKEEKLAAGQRGASVEVPHAVEEVEKVVVKLSSREKQLVTTYYCDYSTMEQKAKDCRIGRNGYWRALNRVRRKVYSELY